YPPSRTAEYSARPDAEAMVALPSGSLWILTKQDDGMSRIFQVKPDASATVVATEVGSLNLRDDQLQGGLSLRATAADLRDGQLLVRTYFRAWQFDVSEQLTGTVNAPARIEVKTGFDIQGESIAYGLDASIWHSSEGLDQPLWKLPCSHPNTP
ncbi:MAG TPA: hypothetical protein DCQ06_02285, partial [Myxococcales bacterium]|nr:hypothetical protein [Myxococcales bacterium]